MPQIQNLKNFLKKYNGKKLLAVFPHFDDFSFVASGLAQLTNEENIQLSLVCLGKSTQSEKSDLEIQKQELMYSAKILGIDKLNLIHMEENDWLQKLKKIVIKLKPFAMLTFDPGGITGHPDHTITSIEVMNLIKNIKVHRPILLWRIADKEERKYFNTSNYYNFNKEPHIIFNLSLKQSITKIKAILAHKSKFSNFYFKLRICEWYLFDHKENYYIVDNKSDNFKLNLTKQKY